MITYSGLFVDYVDWIHIQCLNSVFHIFVVVLFTYYAIFFLQTTRRKLGYLLFITVVSIVFIKVTLESPNVSANYTFRLPEFKLLSQTVTNDSSIPFDPTAASLTTDANAHKSQTSSHKTVTSSQNTSSNSNSNRHSHNNVTWKPSKKIARHRTTDGVLKLETRNVVARKVHPNYEDYVNILTKHIEPVDLMKVVRERTHLHELVLNTFRLFISY